jgi:NAD(P)H-hydrate repair Nnr-like enzyme with NAD(P)H-hydrate dehydratase domain
VLTPHAGECARLLTRLTSQEVTNSEVSADPVSAARRLAELTGATVLLKGSTTIVVGPEGPVRSQAEGPAWLATAGAGDVLAGVIGVLLAQGLDGPVAAALGSLVHSVAADDASGGGPLRARRVAQALPSTIADLLNRGRPTVV